MSGPEQSGPSSDKKADAVINIQNLVKRPLELDDLKKVKGLLLRLFPAVYPDKFYEDIVSVHWTQAFFEKDGTLVGLVSAGEECEQDYNNWGPHPISAINEPFKFMYIFLLGVEPAYRHLNLSSTLMKECIEMARTKDATGVYLHVMADNIPALSLYKKLGFRNFSFLPKFYYPFGSDGFGQALALDSKLPLKWKI